MSHVAHVNESCHNCNWVTSCSVWRDIIACETWLIYCISSVRHDFAWYHMRLLVIACPAMCEKMNFVHTIHNTHVLNIWHMYLSHVNESCHTCNWVMSFSVWHDSSRKKWISPTQYITHMYLIYDTCTWVMSMSHFNESCHTCNWVMSFTLWRDSFRKNKVSSTQYMTHMYLKYDTHVLESRQWVMSHM